MSSTVILLNEQNPQGIFVDPSVPLISVDDQGFTRGDGVFETMLSVNRRVRKLGMHLSRLESSARMLDLPDPEPEILRSAVERLMREATAGAETALGEEHIVKIIISRGPTQAVTSMQPGPYTLIMASPVPASIVKRRTEGVKAMLLPRGHEPMDNSAYPWLLAGAKTLSYAVNMAALRHARDHGADDVVFTSADGYLLEGPTSTVLIVRTGEDGVRRLLTPLRQKGILAGTSQAVIFAAAHADGWELGYGPLVPADLQGAEGVWLVSSVRGVLPVRAVDGVEIPVDHELTGMLQAHLDADGDPGRHVSGDPVPTAG